MSDKLLAYADIHPVVASIALVLAFILCLSIIIPVIWRVEVSYKR